MSDQTQDVGEMEAGRELDVRVGREVMGWEPRYVVDDEAPFFTPRVPEGPPDLLDYWTTGTDRKPCGWSPSTEIAEAWEVVERLLDLRFCVSVTKSATGRSWDVRGSGEDGSARFIAHADTAPLAIVRAALAAVAGTDPTR